MRWAIVIVGAALVLLLGGTLLALGQEQAPQSAGQAAERPTPRPAAQADPPLILRARVVPQHSVELRFPDKGLIPEGYVAEVLVEEDEVVEEGQVLARLDTRDLELRIQEAEAALAMAQANYDEVEAGASPAEIAQARARVAQAQGRARATAGSVTPEDIAAAQAELEEARAVLAQVEAGPKATQVRALEATIAQARARLQSERDRLSAAKSNAELAMEQAANELRNTQDTYSRIKAENEAMGRSIEQVRLDREAAALRDMQNAEKALDQARIAYEQARQAEITGVAQAEAAVQNAEAARDEMLAGEGLPAYAAAVARVAQAEADLARLQGDQRGGTLEAAAAELQNAQVILEQLLAEPRKVDLAVAAAHLQEAEVALKRSQLALEMAALRAPFSGTVVKMNLKVGEMPSVTQPAVVLADFSRWLIVTENLNEVDAVRIGEDASATITFAALPGLEMSGRVDRITMIGQQAEDTRDVIYEAIIVPDQHEPRLRWNMSATLSIEPFVDDQGK